MFGCILFDLGYVGCILFDLGYVDWCVMFEVVNAAGFAACGTVCVGAAIGAFADITDCVAVSMWLLLAFLFVLLCPQLKLNREIRLLSGLLFAFAVVGVLVGIISRVILVSAVYQYEG